MTVDDAIYKIKHRIAIDGFDGKDSEDLKMAIRALNTLKEKKPTKQKSKKVIYSHDSYVYCPHCGREIVSSFMKPSLCPKCHGELDWR